MIHHSLTHTHSILVARFVAPVLFREVNNPRARKWSHYTFRVAADSSLGLRTAAPSGSTQRRQQRRADSVLVSSRVKALPLSNVS